MNFSGVPDDAEYNGWDGDDTYDPLAASRNDMDQVTLRPERTPGVVHLRNGTELAPLPRMCRTAAVSWYAAASGDQ